MQSRSFKPTTIQSDVRSQSPPPPARFVEPLSPVRAVRQLPSAFPAEKSKVIAHTRQHTTNWNNGNRRDRNTKRPAAALAVSTNGPPGRFVEGRSVPVKAQGSPIDTLATIALSTSPTLEQPSHRHLGDVFASGAAPFWPAHSYPARPRGYSHPETDSQDRPSKRARSEALSPPQYHINHQRPATSHNAAPGWPFYAEWSAGAGNEPSTLARSIPRKRVADDQQLEHAELLLSLAKGPALKASRPSGFGPSTSPTVECNLPVSAPPFSANADFTSTSTFGSSYNGKTGMETALPTASRGYAVDDSTYAVKPPVGSHTASATLQTRTPPEETLDAGYDLGSCGINGAKATLNGTAPEPLPSTRPSAKPRPVKGRRESKTYPQVNGPVPLLTESAPHQLQSPQSLPADEADVALAHARVATRLPHLGPPDVRKEVSSQPRRHSAIDAPRPTDITPGNVSGTARTLSVPPENGINASISTAQAHTDWRVPLEAIQDPHTKSVTECATCHLHANSVGETQNWIRCNGCILWFHFACAGFKNEREVRSISKYFCRGCKPKYGPTTFTRKSARAHVVVDYAGLNEGVLRSSDETYEHHYIKPIKDGTLKFLPESFPRMPPELVTAEYFERCGEMAEPIVIPAALNPRPNFPGTEQPMPTDPSTGLDLDMSRSHEGEREQDIEYDYVPDDGQDKLDMVIPQGLTVRRVAELYGPEEKVEVIDVKSQEGGDRRWNMRKWADYYEQEGDKPVRNVISLEVSTSKLGRLIRRPKVVRDLDLQDSVWPQDESGKDSAPKVQFYCLMSVADCYTDFHIDFGGSSVYYHILKGKKTFFFIPPKKQHLKKYEEWCLSPAQNWTFLPDQTKECYRIDLSEGDTMLIPSGWIHAVWTPENSLVIGGNFLTRLHYSMQIRIFEIEKTTKVPRKFRYPFFQKVLWYTVMKYVNEDRLPKSVSDAFYSGKQFRREIPIHLQPNKFGHNSDPGPENYNARYYSKAELDGLPDLAQYVFRTVMISLGRVEGVTTETRNAVGRSIPKACGDPLEVVKTFAIWAAWKRGNEDIPQWAHPDAVLPEQNPGEKKLSAAALKRLDRQAAIDAYRIAPDRSSARQRSKAQEASQTDGTGEASSSSTRRRTSASGRHLSTPKTSVLGPKRIACDACRKRRIRCKHKDELVTLGSGDPSGSQQGPRAAPATKHRNTSSTLVAVVINNSSPRDHKHAPSKSSNATSTPNQVSAPAVAGLDGADDTTDGKRGRTKACADCRKSKRRCIHDENGNVDPVKAQETPVPRGSTGNKKRRVSGADEADKVQKKGRTWSSSVLATPSGFLPPDPLSPPRAELSAGNVASLPYGFDTPSLDQQEAHDSPRLPSPSPYNAMQNGVDDTESSVSSGTRSSTDIELVRPNPLAEASNIEAHEPTSVVPIDPALEMLTSQHQVNGDIFSNADSKAVEDINSPRSPMANEAESPPKVELSSPISNVHNSPPMAMMQTPQTDISLRQSRRQSKPVERFAPTTPTPSAPPRTSGSASSLVRQYSQRSASKSQTPSMQVGQSTSPGAGGESAKRRSRSNTTSSAKKPLGDGDASGGGGERRDSKVKDGSEGAVDGKAGVAEEGGQIEEKTEEDASLRLAKMLAGSEFGLRRR